MESLMRKFFLYLFFASFACGFAFSASYDDKMKLFTEKTAEVVTEAALSLNTTADAYIGRLLPSVPPHFYNSFSLAVPLLDAQYIGDAFNALTSDAGFTINMPVQFLPLPIHGFSTRFGGFYLPFDFGFSAAFAVPATGLSLKISDYNFDMNFTSLAFDLRYALVEGKGKAPKLSLGAGWVYTSNNYSITMLDSRGNTTVGLNLQTESVYLQAQISKKFGFFVPSFGAKAYLTLASDNSYSYEFEPKGTTSVPPKNAEKKLKNGFDINNTQAQLFVNMGFMIPHGHITFAGSWNIRNNLWNVSLHTGYRL